MSIGLNQLRYLRRVEPGRGDSVRSYWPSVRCGRPDMILAEG